MSAKLKAAVPRLASTVLLLARNPHHSPSSPDSAAPITSTAAAAATSTTKNQPAAATHVTRENDIQVLMMKRHGKARFMPSVYVFPGGGVDGADLVTAQQHLATHYGVPLQDVRDDSKSAQSYLEACLQPTRAEAEAEAWACRVGALRELAEEAACVLRGDGCLSTEALWLQDQQRGTGSGSKTGTAAVPSHARHPIYDLYATASLRPVGRWVTPRQSKYRYDTYFYAALVHSAVAAAHGSDGTASASLTAHRMSPQELPLERQASEVAELLWVSPLQALRRHEDPNDSFSLAPPTYLMLHALAAQPSFTATSAAWSGEPPATSTATEEGKDGTPLGTLPYSSVVPCIEPQSTMSADKLRIVDFVLPSSYFHEPGWTVPDGEYLFPGENFSEFRHSIHMVVGAAAREGSRSGEVLTICHS